MAADLAEARPDHPVLKVDWALSAPVPWLAAELAGAGTAHLGGDSAGLTTAAATLAAGGVPERPFLLCGQMNRADPGRSPEGTETLWAYTHLPRRLAGLGPDDPEAAAVVALMEDRLEEHAPGLRGLVLARHVQTPATLERENPSMPGGALGAGTSAPSRQLFFRPTPGLGRADTPVDGLYLAGAAAHPGPGVHGGPGASAARAALRRASPLTGGLYRAAVNAGHRLVY